MDYEVSGQAPNVATGVVNHTQNADGTVSPVSSATPLPVTLVEGVGSIKWNAAACPTTATARASCR